MGTKEIVALAKLQKQEIMVNVKHYFSMIKATEDAFRAIPPKTIWLTSLDTSSGKVISMTGTMAKGARTSLKWKHAQDTCLQHR